MVNGEERSSLFRQLPQSLDDNLELGEVERLAASAATARLRAAYRAVFALDGALRRIALSAQEPLTAQLGLAWWRDACGASAPDRNAHPALAALAESWPGGARALVELVDAWEAVAASDQPFAARVEALAVQRAALFARIAGESPATAIDAARVWTLVTLSTHADDAAQRDEMRAIARRIPVRRLPRALRPLAVLAGLARRALAADRDQLIGDRLSPLAAMRLGIFGR